MKRRNFLSGLAAISLCAGWQTAAQSTRRTRRPSKSNVNTAQITTLKIELDGPFALVFPKNNVQVVRVFVPMSKAPKKHSLLINGKSQIANVKHTAHFLTEAGALKQNTTAIVDPAFSGFNWSSSVDWKNTDDFIEVDFPLPMNISPTPPDRKITHVVFESGGTAEMPPGHILEYQVQDGSKLITLHDDAKGDNPPVLEDPQTLVLSIAVGLPNPPNGNDPDPNGDHAKDFHNNFLLPRFSSISSAPDKRFQSVYQTQSLGTESTSVECKMGGLIITEV